MTKYIGILLLIMVTICSNCGGQTEQKTLEDKILPQFREVLEWYDYQPAILGNYLNPLKIITSSQLDSVLNRGGLENIVALEMTFSSTLKPEDIDFAFFKKLKNLEYLKISHLFVIPPEFYELRNLKVLSMFTLRKVHGGFSKNLANFSNLEFLDLTFANIIVPAAVEKLSNLKALRLYREPLEHAYDAIYNLPNLETLWVNYGDKKDIAGISRLTKLKILYTTLVTKEVGELHNLRGLIIHGNWENTFPEELSSLQNVVAFRLTSCYEIKTAPLFVASWENLEYLEIRDCRKLVEIPKGYLNLNKLKRFDLFYNKLYKTLELHFNEFSEIVNIKNH